ncbi:hypothetical protein [Kitasatospora sp. NPDC091207]|uniref:hypothetical protein n=1 Tax=Kitasatospora sp. NPDC091207 TaxID=3364083 RepID=UPI00381EB210
MAERAARRPRPRVLPLAVAAAVLAAGAGGGLWLWQPWHTVEVPASGCWSVLGQHEIRTLVGEDGKAADTTVGTLANTRSNTGCGISWLSGGKRRTALQVDVQERDEKFREAKTRTEAGGSPQTRPVPLDFGAGAQGWLFHDGTTQLLFRCEDPADPTSGFVYRDLIVSGDATIAGAPRADVYRVRIGVALRTAREIVRQQSCANAPQLAAQTPPVPPI